MGETATRNTERTRRAILDAARAAIREHGTHATIGAIAQAAGVTKGGLLHHFPSREILLQEVARDALERFRAKALALVDLSENHPGKLVRGYVRAVFDEAEHQADCNDPTLWTTLCVIPEVAHRVQEDTDDWRTRCGEDGLHPDRILLACSAAEGFMAGAPWDTSLRPETIDRARAAILALTDRNGPLVPE